MNKIALNVSVKYGLLVGSLIVLSNLIMFNMDFTPGGFAAALVIGMGAVFIIVKLAFLARAHYEFNEKNNDYISFADAILIGLVVLGISSLMSVAITFINYYFINTEKMNSLWRLGEGVDISPVKIILMGALSGLLIDVIMLFFLITLESLWKIFKKAGKEGWAALIPFYNTITMLNIVGKPVIWFVLMFIPVVNVILGIWVVNLLAKRFGKSEGYTIGMLFLPFVFYPMLGMSEQQMIPLYAEDNTAV